MAKKYGHNGVGSDVEKLDPTPVEMPVGASTPTPLSELIARAVHAQLQAQSEEGYETPEEADDFEEEDPDVLDLTPYEEHLQPALEENETESSTLPPEPEPRAKGLSPKEVLDRAYGEGNYPIEWLGQPPDPDEVSRPEDTGS